MFSGLVEALGVVRAVTPRDALVVLEVEAPGVTDDLAVGDSLAVNGTCLTVVRRAGDVATLEAVPETLRRTNLGQLRPGDGVNLERAVLPTTRLGGHVVQGHVDACGTVRAVEAEGDSRLVRFEAPPEILRYVVDKGFVAVDGASLTVVDHDASSFRIAYIPHTLAHTVAGRYRPGARVNIETDILGKYVERLLDARLDPPGAPPGRKEPAP